MDEKKLVNIYCDILKDIEPRFLTPGAKDGLSGLFLASMPEHYATASNRIMIVGCETRAWRIEPHPVGPEMLEDYVYKCLKKQREILLGGLSDRTSRGASFFNFVRSVAERSGSAGLIYTNLLCYAWRNGSPLRCGDLGVITHYSEQLLKAQIRFFQPDTIIFANGIASTGVRRSFFPADVCSNSRSFEDQGVRKHHLWSFDLDMGIDHVIRCYRIHHPSTRPPHAKEAREARRFLVSMLPEGAGKIPSAPAAVA